MIGRVKLRDRSLLLVIFLVLLLVAAGVYFIASPNNRVEEKPAKITTPDSLALSDQFPRATSGLSHKQLLERSFKQLLSVERVSYKVQMDDIYTGTCSYDLTKGAAGRIYANLSTRMADTAVDSEITSDNNGLFVKYSRYETSGPIDVLGDYKDKWLYVADRSQFASVGRLPFAWLVATNAPVVIGLVGSSEKKYLEQAIDASVYTIKDSKATSYRGTKAVTYTILMDQKIYNALFSTDKLDRVRSVPVIAAREKVYASGDNTFEVTIGLENGQLFELVTPSSSGDFNAKATYNEFKFDGVELPAIPASSVPIEEFINSET